MFLGASRQLLTGLALAALAWAQLFGMTRGYLCDCGGQVAITAFNHCHGPHSAKCHDHDEAPAHHDHHHEDLPAGDTHEHLPVKETVVAEQPFAKASGAAVQFVAIAAAWAILTAPVARDEPFVVPTALLRDDGGGRSWPRLLAHTIALRV